MDLFNGVLFAVSFCSLIHSYAQAGACQDKDPVKCPQYAGHCSKYANIKQQCPLTCKLCVISATPSAQSSFPPSPTSSLSLSMTSSSNLSPTQSATVVLKSSVDGNEDHRNWNTTATATVVLKSSVDGNEDNRNRNTTATASASKRDLQHVKMLMTIGFLCGYFFSRR